MDVRVARLRDFLSADPSNSDLACELADLLVMLGASAEAESVLIELPAPASEIPGVQFRLARCSLACGRYAKAEAILTALIDAGHDSSAVSHDLAFAQLCRRQPDVAAATVERALARFGDVSWLRTLAGRVALMQERRHDAVEQLDVAIRLDPNDSQARGVRALALFDGSSFEQAADAARDCLERDPDQHEALLVAGMLSLWGQQLDEAQVLFERALARHPNSGRALSGYGQWAMLSNDLPRAQDALQAAVHAMPDHIGTWHALAWTQLLQGQRDEAEHSYRQAYAIDRNFGDTHGGLALIAAMRGDHAAAEQGVQRALRLDPGAFTARYAKSLLLEASGDNEGSERIMRDLLGSGGPGTLSAKDFAVRLKQTLRMQ